MDPAMCECVWLMIVVGCVCSLGEESVYGCGCIYIYVWVFRGGGQEGYVFCCNNLYYGLIDF